MSRPASLASSSLPRFLAGASALGITLGPEARARFARYEQLILEWNRRINLISRKDTHRIADYHFLDSITACPLIPEESRAADLGSGAGLPGVPVKIVRSDISLVLIESVRKKALFLDFVVRELGLDRTEVWNRRIEEIAQNRDQGPGVRDQGSARTPDSGPPTPDPRPHFDVLLSRLLGSIRDVVRIAAPLLAPGGVIILYKSATAEAEIKQAQPALNRLRLQVREIRDYPAGRAGGSPRRLVVIRRDRGA